MNSSIIFRFAKKIVNNEFLHPLKVDHDKVLSIFISVELHDVLIIN